MKKLNIIAMCLVASILVACGGGSGTGEKYELCYKLEPGKTYSQKMVMDAKTTAKVMGQSMDMGVLMSMDVNNDIVDTTGVISANARFTKVLMEITSPYGNMSYSSDNDSEDPIIKMLKAMTETNFTMTMTKYGNVTSMTGFEEMTENMYSSMGLSPSEAAQAKAIMEQSFSEEKMMEQMKNMAIYPNHAVAVGDSWEMNVSGQLDMENKYTLKKVTDNELTIEVESKINNAKVDGFSGTIKGTQKGTIIAHRSSGWIKEATIKQDISGSGTIQGMNADMTVRSTVTMSE